MKDRDRAALVVSFEARPDGRVVLRATRPDGSSTWQVHEGPRAAFFPFHDLTHLAVETVLGTRDGFYGLLAAGWDIADTGGRGARGPLPPEAVLVEHLVGLLDGERIGGAAPLTAATLQAQLATLVAAGRLAAVPALTDAQLARVREAREMLHEAWARTPMAQSFERRYTRPGASALTWRAT